jgi:hypothetical protein
MRHFRLAAAAWFIFSLTVLAACTHPEPARYPTSDASLRAFLLGTTGQPGSAARAEASRMLKREIEAAFAKADLKRDAEQARAKRIYLLAAESLASASSCAPAERVRVYRGFGEQPLVRAPGTAQGAAHFNAINGAVVEALQARGLLDDHRLPKGERDAGELMFGELGGSTPLPWSPLPTFADGKRRAVEWREILGFGRTGVEVPDAQGRWNQIAMVHSALAPASPLLSVSLDPSVAEAFGPAVLVLDVCPERLFPAILSARGKLTFSETEMYLPLFALPEEVVRLEGVACRDLLRTQKDGGPGCRRGRFGLSDPDRASARTETFRRIFLNYGHPFEKEFAHAATLYGNGADDYVSWPYSHYKANVDQFYKALSASDGTLAGWRKAVLAFKPSESCETALALLENSEYVETDMRALGESVESETDPKQKQWKLDAGQALPEFHAGLERYRAFLAGKGCAATP